MEIREFLKKNRILFDGAFGTYYLEAENVFGVPERANIEAPEQVHRIHREYLEAGANLIRTNTFAVQEETLQENRNFLKNCLEAGYRIAEEEADRERKRSEREIFVAADIGPLPAAGSTQDAGTEFYQWAAEILLQAGAKILLFETFPDMEAIIPVIQEVKKKYHPFIIVQFCLNQYGYSSTGASARQLFQQASEMEEIDAVGLNCGNGPGHTLHILQGLQLPQNKFITALPNAGYPKLSRNRMIYHQNVAYFSEKMQEIADLGIDMIGGCCGTSPSYIREIEHLAREKKIRAENPLIKTENKIPEGELRKTNAFYLPDVSGNEKKQSAFGGKIIAAELIPPENVQIQKLMDAANALKAQNVDVLTFPDSPSGRTRIDSIAMAVKVHQETGMQVMPHICCRDKNSIAMIAQIMGAYINEIRNFLVITGDPIPAASRSDVKSVFSYNSIGMMQILNEMNQNQFRSDGISYGGALNCGAANMDAERKRMEKKIRTGADFFLTQPIFNRIEADNFRKAKEETGARILCGLMPLVGFRNARFMQNEIAGINVTDETVARFRPDMSREEAENTGVEICREIVDLTWDVADGYYFSIPFYRSYLLSRILEGRETNTSIS